MKYARLIFLFCTASVLQIQAYADSSIYGLFMIVKGDVTFQNPNSPVEKAKVGLKVFEGATITSMQDSRAKIVMSDRNVLNLSPDSKLTIQKYETAANKKNVSLSLEEGKVRVNVEQKYDGTREKFLLKTPTVVAGVRGTQFLATYNSNTKTSSVVTFKGVVAMTSFNAAGQPISTVNVEKGQSSSAGAGQAPETPKALPKEEIKELDKSTASAGAENKSDRSSSTSSSSTKEASAEKKEPKMTNSKDLDTDIAKDIKVTNSDTNRPAPPLAPPPVNLAPQFSAPKDFVRDAIQNQNSKTTVIINVK